MQNQKPTYAFDVDGHTAEVMRRNYLVVGFPADELRKWRDVYLVEWGKRL